MKHTFLFATIASILSINAYAVSATVTSKDYVDTTRQATIPAARTNASTPGDTVVTYTDTAGVIGERFICDAYNNGDGDCNADDLVARDVLDQMIPTGTADTVVMYNNNGDIGGERGIYDGSTIYNSSTDSDKLVTAAALQSATNLPTKTLTYKTCYDWSGTPYTDANCILWNLRDTPAYAGCETNADCPACDGTPVCENGGCFCNTR